MHKAHTDVLTESISSPVIMNVARMLAVLITASSTTIFTALLYLPFTMMRMGNVFHMGDYIACYCILMLLGAWLGCLLSAALYQITRRVDASFIIFVALALFCMSDFARESFLLRWINPIVPILSDDFSNTQPLAMAAYNRLTWLLVFGGGWVFSLLCTRKYGMGLAASLLRNMRRVYAPVMASIMLLSGGMAYARQPFVNNAPIEEFFREVDYVEGVMMHSIDIDARPNTSTGHHCGTATYRMSNDNTQPVRQTMSINTGYKVSRLTVDGQELVFTDLKNTIYTSRQIEFQLPPGENMAVVVEYGGYPQLWRGQESVMGGDEVSGRFIYLANEAFAPMMEADYDELTTKADITLPGHMQPVLFGASTTEEQGMNADGSKRWRLELTSPIVFLFAADYVRTDASIPGMSIDFYYSRKHEEIMERVHIEDTLREVAQYATDNIGELTFTADEKLKLMQMTAFIMGGFAGGGTSVMGETSFAEEGMKDPRLGASGQEVMAHEILHQWWGLGMMFEESEEDIEWSSEGFAVYSTYRMMKQKHGADYAQKYYVDVWQTEAEKMHRDFYHRHPECLDKLPQQYRDRIQAAKQETAQYCEMPLKILKAAELIGGEERMDEIMRGLYVRNSEEYIPLTYDGFLDECGLTREDLAL